MLHLEELRLYQELLVVVVLVIPVGPLSPELALFCVVVVLVATLEVVEEIYHEITSGQFLPALTPLPMLMLLLKRDDRIRNSFSLGEKR